MAEKSGLRLIKENEIAEAAKIMAESFQNYPLYDVFFPNKEKRVDLLTRFYLVSIRARRSYTYVTDDLSFVGCLKYPGDKMKNLILTALHPKCFFRCLPLAFGPYFKLMNELSAVTKTVRDKYYDPKKIGFVEAICIRSDARSQVSFFRLFRENHKGETIYAETADPKLVRLYQIIGFEVQETVEWRGVQNRSLLCVPKEKQE